MNTPRARPKPLTREGGEATGRSQPKNPRASRTAWIRREPPADAIDRVLFLLERIDRVYSLFIMRDLGRLYEAAGAARPKWAEGDVKGLCGLGRTLPLALCASPS